MEYYMKAEMLDIFKSALINDEKSDATISKYLRDVRGFFDFLGEEKQVTKEIVIAYKQKLTGNYLPASVNSMLASVNCFLKKMGWYECVVKTLKLQRQVFRPKDRELSQKEYYRLLRAAKEKKDTRLYLLMETICATGIRVSELAFITVEAVQAGRATVSLKGKTRTVLIPRALCRELKEYIKSRKIKKGHIFITKNGKTIDRSNILHAMKRLCKQAGIDRKKVFPHNLRHLFACVYYQSVKDISRLADILGHSNINTTRIYTCVSGEEQERQMEKLGLVVPEQKKPHNNDYAV